MAPTGSSSTPRAEGTKEEAGFIKTKRKFLWGGTHTWGGGAVGWGAGSRCWARGCSWALEFLSGGKKKMALQVLDKLHTGS